MYICITKADFLVVHSFWYASWYLFTKYGENACHYGNQEVLQAINMDIKGVEAELRKMIKEQPNNISYVRRNKKKCAS